MKHIYGTEGDDKLLGTDTVWWAPLGVTWWRGDDYEILKFGGNDIIAGLAGNDEIDGCFGDDLLLGGTGNDTLKGGSGSDTLKGEIGDDVLKGGAGHDLLQGGEGKDHFVFEEHSGIDTILDFEQGQDKLEITYSLYATVEEVLASMIYDSETMVAHLPFGIYHMVEIIGLHDLLTAEDIIIF